MGRDHHLARGRAAAFLAVSAALLLVSIGLVPARAADEYLVDSLVKKGKPTGVWTDYKGFATFSSGGQGQTVTKRTHAGRRAKFSFAYYNAGNVPDNLVIQGCKGTKGLVVRYFIQGIGSSAYDVDVTAEVVPGTVMGTIYPGVGAEVLVKVAVPSGARPGARWSCKLRVTSQVPATYDVSRFRLKVPR